VENQELRGMIRGFILSDPGVNMNEIQHRLQVPLSTLYYHLRVLEREGLIHSFPDGRRKCFVPHSMSGALPRDGLSKRERDIIDVIARKGPLNQKELIREIGLSRRVIIYHMEKLVDMGEVRSEKRGKLRLYWKEAEEIDVDWST